MSTRYPLSTTKEINTIIRYEGPVGGGGLVSTVDDYHAYFRMLLNHGMHGGERILSRAAVELMTTNCR